VTDLNLAAYARMGIANPVSEGAVLAMLDQTDLKPGERGAELGCGNAEVARLLARRGLTVLAVDRGEAMADLARARVAEAGLSDRIEVVAAEAGAAAEAAGPFRLIAALGTTQLGDFGQLSRWLEPGGWLLWGDIFWHQAPTVPVPGLDYDTDAGWRRRGAEAGLRLVAARISPEAEWEAYVAALTAAAAAWAEANPDDPARSQIAARAAALVALYGPASRSTLGFGLYLFRRR
jgi:SAM-dependent methyltransferase